MIYHHSLTIKDINLLSFDGETLTLFIERRKSLVLRGLLLGACSSGLVPMDLFNWNAEERSIYMGLSVLKSLELKWISLPSLKKPFQVLLSSSLIQLVSIL